MSTVWTRSWADVLTEHAPRYETARRQQSKGWELRTTISLARLWQRQGRRDEARHALAAIYGTYTEGFTTPDLVDATAPVDSLAEIGAV